MKKSLKKLIIKKRTLSNLEKYSVAAGDEQINQENQDAFLSIGEKCSLKRTLKRCCNATACWTNKNC